MNPILTDQRDQALYRTCPLDPVPRYSEFVPLQKDGRRMLGAEDGLYFEVKSDYMHACIKVADSPMPYGKLEEFIVMRNGKVPSRLLQNFVMEACEASPVEIAGIIRPELNGYSLYRPQVESHDESHIRYADIEPDRLVIDLHSHGRHGAFFSATDDVSDLSRVAPYISIVVGNCLTYRDVRWCARFVCGHYLINLDANGRLIKSVLG